jgi:hypothetical protein
VANNNPPRRIDIKGQDHMLAYITPEEGGILQLLGGAGKPGPMGIPSFYDGDGGVSEGTDEADASAAADDAAAAETGQPTQGPNTGMGLDDSVASMANAMAGHTAGTTGYGNVQGSINYSPVGKIGFDIFGLQNMMNKHARGSLSKGQQPSFGFDNKGNITSVTGPGGPSVGIPGTGIVGLAANIGNMMGATTTTGYGMDTEDTGLGGGDGNGSIDPIQPYQLPTNPYNRNEYRGTELPINTTIPNSPITTDPTVQDPNAERDYNLSQGLNEGYDFAKSPFAGMSINDTQLLTAPKEFSGVSSLDPLGAQDVYSNVTNDNMVKSYQDSAKGLDSVGADLRANKGYGM